MGEVTFVGAGPGDPELITLKGWRALQNADTVIYAGSLVNPAVLDYCQPGVELFDSQKMTLEETLTVMVEAVRAGKRVVRLHSGDPSLYGAIQEQMTRLAAHGIPYQVIPGVSSFLAAAAAIKREYTVPEVCQTVIISRLDGQTPVPEKERLGELARHRASMCLFLSVQYIAEVVNQLLEGYPAETPVMVIEKASWPEERVISGTLADIAGKVATAGITRTALILVGDFLRERGTRSKLYHPDFSHGSRG